jgi:hypothetical protein
MTWREVDFFRGDGGGGQEMKRKKMTDPPLAGPIATGPLYPPTYAYLRFIQLPSLANMLNTARYAIPPNTAKYTER